MLETLDHAESVTRYVTPGNPARNVDEGTLPISTPDSLPTTPVSRGPPAAGWPAAIVSDLALNDTDAVRLSMQRGEAWLTERQALPSGDHAAAYHRFAILRQSCLGQPPTPSAQCTPQSPHSRRTTTPPAPLARQPVARGPCSGYKLGEEPGEDLSATTTAAERIAMVWQLTLDAWALTGRPWPDCPRTAAPGRVVRPASAAGIKQRPADADGDGD